jgi:hypothetical protein
LLKSDISNLLENSILDESLLLEDKLKEIGSIKDKISEKVVQFKESIKMPDEFKKMSDILGGKNPLQELLTSPTEAL